MEDTGSGKAWLGCPRRGHGLTAALPCQPVTAAVGCGGDLIAGALWHGLAAGVAPAAAAAAVARSMA
ncbi:hypothetical protein CHLRE_06g255626v5 [Chlamydomonas reinhardtii]|uniref:Uncharacterized protein n=1 Tax=Chlamydomonas reinhardtii TaxID=3055 RepID=A0A2K3DMD3_CHLRE|nr:uncharacterized protein CHLRE_06g255626v5 [Chlamydomonas reinhardtii]PNW81673.1 hypothetical protein CHLRE_06g255626v5 [Chlamydomonas reinhardtii]